LGALPEDADLQVNRPALIDERTGEQRPDAVRVVEPKH
jgi:hypothetical protein